MRQQWTIGRKLIVSFLVLAGITLLLGFVGYYGVARGGQSITEIGAVRLPSVQSLLTIVEGELRIKAAQRTLLNPGASDEDRKRQPQTIADAKTACEQALGIYGPLPKQPKEQEAWKEFGPVWVQWHKDNDELLKLNDELQALGIPNPPVIQRDLFEVRGTLWKTICSLTKQIKEGVELKDTDKTNTLLVPSSRDWTQSLKVANATVTKILQEIAPANAAMLASVPVMEECVTRGDRAAALVQLETVFVPNAMKVIEGMRPIRAEAEKAAQLYEKMNHQGMVVCRASQTTAEGLLGKLVEANTTAAEASVKAGMAMAAFLNALSLAATVIGLVLAVGLGILISRGINNALRRIAASLGTGADQTASAAGQVAQSSQAMAEGASQQASSLEETSASLEQMTSMTKQNADSANQAASLMAQTKETVGAMARATEEMSTAILEIKGSADQTAKIIKTIDEIAFQTNLLALNAAVEAARAGDAGKGFAVVAEEVRNLAQRSAEAAKNTSSLIEGSVKSAENGVLVSRRVADSLKQTVEYAGKVAELINEIAAAGKEQAQGIEQINIAMAQMDQVTQSNAASSEEAASASEQLSAQAEEMNHMVRELVAMVGGSGEVTHETSLVPTNAGARRTTVAELPSREATEERRRPSPPRQIDGGYAVLNPRQVVPLDEDELNDV